MVQYIVNTLEKIVISPASRWFAGTDIALCCPLSLTAPRSRLHAVDVTPVGGLCDTPYRAGCLFWLGVLDF